MFVHTRTVSEVDIRPHHSVSTTPCVVCAWPIVWLFVRLLTVAFCLHVCVHWLHQHGFAMGNVEVLLTTPTMSWTLGGVTPVRNQVTIPSAAVAAQIAAGSARVVIRVGGVDAMAGCVHGP